ncbi:MAG: hypothetical protein RI894_2258 [Bacteroidota bacterium]
MQKQTFLFIILLFVSHFLAAQGQKAPIKIDNSEKELLIQFENEAAKANFVEKQGLDAPNSLFYLENSVIEWQVYILKLKETAFKTILENDFKKAAVAVENIRQTAQKTKGVAHIQRNTAIKQRNLMPNDTYFEAQTNMSIIKAPAAWQFGTGGVTALGDTIVVAVLEMGGGDYSCEDLAPNIWHNNGEIPQNGIDDDGNGYIDDYQGWNFTTQDDNVSTLNRHGTSISSVIGAKGNNNIGVTGVNWNVKMLMISGASTQAQIVEAYHYVYALRKKYDATKGREGAFIVATNASFGIDNAHPTDFPLWCAMYDTLGKAGIITAAATADATVDVDVVGDMPTTCESNYLIGVSASDEKDKLLSYVGFGKKSVDLTSPIDVFSISPENNYTGGVGGTSGATPHVTGAVALLHSLANPAFARAYRTNPATAALVIREAILQNTDKNDELKNKVSSGGRLNLYRSFAYLNNYYPDYSTETSIINIYPNPTAGEVAVLYGGTDGNSVTFELFDAIGQIIWIKRQIISIGSRTLAIDLSTLPSSVYLIRIIDEKGAYNTRKIVKI